MKNLGNIFKMRMASLFWYLISAAFFTFAVGLICLATVSDTRAVLLYYVPMWGIFVAFFVAVLLGFVTSVAGYVFGDEASELQKLAENSN